MRKKSTPSYAHIFFWILGALIFLYLVATYLFGMSFLGFSHPKNPDNSPKTPNTDSGRTICDLTDLAPVCASNGITYGNDCLAKNANATVIYSGSCEEMHANASGSTLTPGIIETDSGATNESQSGSTNLSTSGTLIPPPTSLDDVYGTGEVHSGSLALYDSGSYHLYHNEYLDYSFAMPNYTYYQGYGAQDGAAHTMAAALTGSGIEDFATAPIQIYYYTKTPANPPSDLDVAIPGGILYVKTQGTLSDKEKNIIKTILESAE